MQEVKIQPRQVAASHDRVNICPGMSGQGNEQESLIAGVIIASALAFSQELSARLCIIEYNAIYVSL
jgi:hypothetical protein